MTSDRGHNAPPITILEQLEYRIWIINYAQKELAALDAVLLRAEEEGGQ